MPRSRKLQENPKSDRDELGRLLPGHTGNPNGRPRKGTTFRELAQNLPDQTKGEIIDSMADLAKSGGKGAVSAAVYLTETAEGKPTQRVETFDEAAALQAELLGALVNAGLVYVVNDQPAIEGEYTLLNRDTRDGRELWGPSSG